MKKTFLQILLYCVLVSLSSCGANSDDNEVTSVRFLAGNIQIGESVRVEVEFNTKTNFFGQVRLTTLTFEVSPDLIVQGGTFNIYENDDDTDEVTPEQIILCPDGRTLVHLDLNRSDLSSSSFDGEAKIKFNVIGKKLNPAAPVRAAAGENDTLSCEQAFVYQDEANVEISLQP